MGLRGGALVRQGDMGWWVEPLLFVSVEGVTGDRFQGSLNPYLRTILKVSICPSCPLWDPLSPPSPCSFPSASRTAPTHHLGLCLQRPGPDSGPVTGCWGVYLAWEMGGRQGLPGCGPTDQPGAGERGLGTQAAGVQGAPRGRGHVPQSFENLFTCCSDPTCKSSPLHFGICVQKPSCFHLPRLC